MPTSPAGRNEPIGVGVLYALWGVGVAYEESARRGLGLALTEINRAGRIVGRPVDILLNEVTRRSVASFAKVALTR